MMIDDIDGNFIRYNDDDPDDDKKYTLPIGCVLFQLFNFVYHTGLGHHNFKVGICQAGKKIKHTMGWL